MKKKTWYNILAMVLMVVVVVGMNEQVVFSEAISDLPVSYNTVSENGSGKINVLGQYNGRLAVERQRASMPECITITLPDTGFWSFQQTFARTELFNAFQEARMNSNNWWWHSGDVGSEKVYTKVTKPYVYDYELEKAAMQRAIEQAFSYGHYRPNTVCADEVYDDLNSPYWWSNNTNELTGMNKPVNNTSVTAQQIVAAYMEENEPRGKQDHRVAILTDGLYRIGIGCVRTADGRVLTAIALAEDMYEYDYVVNNGLEDFTIPLGEYTAPVDGYKEVQIELGIHIGTELDTSWKKGNDFELKVGESCNFIQQYGNNYMVDNGSGVATVTVANGGLTTWKSNDNSVVTVDQAGNITAVGAGTTTVVADGTYFSLVLSVEVTAPSAQPTNPNPSSGNPPLEITPGDDKTGGGNENQNPPLEITPEDTKDTPPAEVKGFTKKYNDVYYKYDGKNVTAYKSSNKKSITIPKTITYKGKAYVVTKIGTDCFKNKTKLQTITIKANTTSIGTRAFKGCTALKKVTIPSSVTSIGKNAFEGCKALTSVTIGKNVKTIGAKAFYNCKSLKKVTFKGTKLKTVGKNAFTKINKNAVVKVPASKLKAYKKLLNGKYTKGVTIKKG